MTKFHRISGKCQVIISREFGYAVIGSMLGLLASLSDFGLGLMRNLSPVFSLSGILGLILSLIALFVASDYIRDREFTGKVLIFCSGGILISLGVFGRPGLFEMTQPSFAVRLISFLPILSSLLLIVSSRKFMQSI